MHAVLSSAVSTSPVSDNGRAIIFMVGAMACFVCNDTLMKYLGSELPIAQATAIRSVIVALLLAASGLWPLSSFANLASNNSNTATLRLPLPWKLLTNRWIVLRALCDAVGTLLYLSALVYLPIANASAIGMAMPLILVLFAAVILHERVGVARSLLVVVGFSGVLIVIQPSSSGFSPVSWICLLGVVLQALRDLFTQKVPRHAPSRLVSMSSALTVGLVAFGVSLVQGWLPMNLAQCTILLVTSLFLAAAYQLIVTSLRTGELSVISPYRYSTLLFALFIGYAVWGDVPNPLAWGGIALIVTTGLIMMRLQRVN